MKKTQLVIAVIVATGLAAAPLAAEAKKHTAQHHASTSHTMKHSGSANPSIQGNVGPGTNQAGSMK